MELNLIDELILLGLDDEKGVFVSDSTAFAYGLAGAVIFELTLRDRVELRKEKLFVKNRKPTGDRIIDVYLDTIVKSKKEKSLHDWVEILGEEVETIKKQTIDKLILAGILTKREEKILWVFTNNKYPAQNSTQENLLRRRLCQLMENKEEPKLNEVMLISLIDSCSLNEEVFGKEKAETYKDRIKSVVENTKNSAEINKTVKEIHEQIVAIFVMFTVTTMLLN